MRRDDANFNRFWVILATFDHPGKARILKTCLEEQSIEARIRDERRLQRLWFLARPRAGIHVEVRNESLETARTCLATRPGARAVFKEAIHCPACHSSRVQYPAMTRKNILPTIVAHALVLLRIARHEFYCEDCHFTWGGSHRRRVRPRRVPTTARASGTVS